MRCGVSVVKILRIGCSSQSVLTLALDSGNKTQPYRHHWYNKVCPSQLVANGLNKYVEAMMSSWPDEFERMSSIERVSMFVVWFECDSRAAARVAQW